MSEKTKLLRFTDDGPKTFPELGAELGRDDTFTVPADEAERYLRRSDVEDAGELPRLPRGSRRKPSAADAGAGEAEDIPGGSGGENTAEAGPLAGEAASGDAADGEEG